MSTLLLYGEGYVKLGQACLNGGTAGYSMPSVWPSTPPTVRGLLSFDMCHVRPGPAVTITIDRHGRPPVRLYGNTCTDIVLQAPA